MNLKDIEVGEYYVSSRNIVVKVIKISKSKEDVYYPVIINDFRKFVREVYVKPSYLKRKATSIEKELFCD